MWQSVGGGEGCGGGPLAPSWRRSCNDAGHAPLAETLSRSGDGVVVSVRAAVVELFQGCLLWILARHCLACLPVGCRQVLCMPVMITRAPEGMQGCTRGQGRRAPGRRWPTSRPSTTSPPPRPPARDGKAAVSFVRFFPHVPDSILQEAHTSTRPLPRRHNPTECPARVNRRRGAAGIATDPRWSAASLASILPSFPSPSTGNPICVPVRGW